MVLVRKISLAKWSTSAPFAEGEISADAVTADLRTTGNALSMWKGCHQGETALEDAVLALASGFERGDKLDVVWLEKRKLVKAGVSLQQTPGSTPIADLQDRHFDATELDLVRLGEVAKAVAHAVQTQQYHRFTKKDVLRLIAKAVVAKRVRLEDLKEKLRSELIAHLRQGPPQVP
jgi:hypothetical protein